VRKRYQKWLKRLTEEAKLRKQILEEQLHQIEEQRYQRGVITVATYGVDTNLQLKSPSTVLTTDRSSSQITFSSQRPAGAHMPQNPYEHLQKPVSLTSAPSLNVTSNHETHRRDTSLTPAPTISDAMGLLQIQSVLPRAKPPTYEELVERYSLETKLRRPLSAPQRVRLSKQSTSETLLRRPMTLQKLGTDVVSEKAKSALRQAWTEESTVLELNSRNSPPKLVPLTSPPPVIPLFKSSSIKAATPISITPLALAPLRREALAEAKFHRSLAPLIGVIRNSEASGVTILDSLDKLLEERGIKHHPLPAPSEPDSETTKPSETAPSQHAHVLSQSPYILEAAALSRAPVSPPSTTLTTSQLESEPPVYFIPSSESLSPPQLKLAQAAKHSEARVRASSEPHVKETPPQHPARPSSAPTAASLESSPKSPLR
jgi:hypothetical protein